MSYNIYFYTYFWNRPQQDTMHDIDNLSSNYEVCRRVKHLDEILLLDINKKKEEIPSEFRDIIKNEASKELTELNNITIKFYLKKNKKARYYNYISSFIKEINSIDDMNETTIKDLKIIFSLFVYNKKKFLPPRRTFISYNFLLYNLIFLLDPHSSHLKLLPHKFYKSNIEIWNKAIKILGWPPLGSCFEDQMNKKVKKISELVESLNFPLEHIELSIKYYLLDILNRESYARNNN